MALIVRRMYPVFINQKIHTALPDLRASLAELCAASFSEARMSGTLPHSPECRLPRRRLAQTAVFCMHLQRLSTCRGALERPDMPRAHACHGRLTRHPRGECHVGHTDPCRLAEVPGLPDGNNCICIRGYGHLKRCGGGT
ncbi:hypothetical protein K523DRAFT_161319 [Schizophyllum commune Tattone D]|nr:hypothetical protein K523DRAFT_161319 [Schizophyllum commune Tattone D]